MALSEAVSVAVDRLVQGDAEDALALSVAAGWNQTAADWRFFIGAGTVLGSRSETGRLVATAAALPYGGKAAWVSMVLVAAEARHRGLATALVGRCLAALRAEGRSPLLDATPAGAAVYRRLGFADGFGFERWEGGVDGAAPAAGAGVAKSGPADAAEIAALDAAAAGFDRTALIHELLSRDSTRAWIGAERQGFVIARAGQSATQIGPLVAATQSGALALLDAALAASSGPVFIDVPVRCGAIADRLADHGFSRQRPFTRMAMVAGSPGLAASDSVFSLAGPEFC